MSLITLWRQSSDLLFVIYGTGSGIHGDRLYDCMNSISCCIVILSVIIQCVSNIDDSIVSLMFVYAFCNIPVFYVSGLCSHMTHGYTSFWFGVAGILILWYCQRCSYHFQLMTKWKFHLCIFCISYQKGTLKKSTDGMSKIIIVIICLHIGAAGIV